MTCWDRCKTDAYDSVVRRIEEAENKNLDQDNAITEIRRTMPDAIVVDGLEANVSTLQKEKLDNTHMDEDIHFGPVAITKDGTAIIASFDTINPVTGENTPMSILLPGATSTNAGVMDASSVAWITEAEERISALEGLSDVKALVGLSASPTQAEINAGWMDATNKPPETGDLVQDVSNSKLWVFVTDSWILYGTLVTVPLATTTSLGGIKDTSPTAPANRWYNHVEADGRLALIGGDTLSTLLDTTVPGIQTALDGKVGKMGNEDIAGIKTFKNGIFNKSTQDIGVAGYNFRIINRLNDANDAILFDDRITKESNKATGRKVTLGNKDSSGTYFSNQHFEFLFEDRSYREGVITPSGTWLYFRCVNTDGTGHSITPMRETPGTMDVVNYSRLLDAYDEMVGYVNDQDALSVKKTGDEVIDGVKTFVQMIDTEGGRVRFLQPNGNWGEVIMSSSEADQGRITFRIYRDVNGTKTLGDPIRCDVDGDEVYTRVFMRSNPGVLDAVNKGYLDARLDAMTTALAKAGMTINIEEPSKEENANHDARVR